MPEATPFLCLGSGGACSTWRPGQRQLAALPQLLQIHVSALDPASSCLDSAVAICFDPGPLGHLLLSTSSHTVTVLDTASGRVVREVSPGLWSACNLFSPHPSSMPARAVRRVALGHLLLLGSGSSHGGRLPFGGCL